MKVSKQSRRGAKEIFRSCQTNGALDEACVRQAVQSLLKNKPRGYQGILSHFQRLVKLDIQRRTARIESAVPLPSELQSSVQTALTRHYGPGLLISFGENPALIGGMRIKVGSDVYDGSVQAKLAALQEKF
jgi:F-type H+-transporting ATPase subunit delta